MSRKGNYIPRRKRLQSDGTLKDVSVGITKEEVEEEIKKEVKEDK